MLINKTTNERGEITTDTIETKRIIRDYEQSYTNKLDNLEEGDQFSESYDLPRLNHKEIENLNKPITSTEIETVLKKASKKQ